jgi:hypothetical protein
LPVRFIVDRLDEISRYRQGEDYLEKIKS